MSATLKFGNGKWATKEGSLLGYNSENNNYKPLPFTFDRASSATRVNKDGLIETVGADQPRIDYLNDSNGALLLEPERTNLVTQSNNTTTNAWGHYNYTGGIIVDTYGYPSPNGKNEASRLVYTNSSLGSGGALLTSNITLLATGVYTISLWAKSVSGTKEFRFSPKSTASAGPAGSRITLTNQWKRYTHTFTNDGGTSRGFQFRLSEAEDSGDRTFDVWGMTIEEGSYETSTIPTSGSAVTRLADSCEQTPPDGVIGQTEGTVFLDFNVNAIQDNGRIFAIGDGGTNNRVLVRFETNGYLAFASTGGVFQWSHTEATLSLGRHKMAIAYALNDVAFYVDGILVNSESTYSVPVTDKFYIGTSEYGGAENTNMKINNSKLYNTRLSNSELAALTQV